MTSPARVAAGTVRVAVFDYGSGNLHSVCRALDAAGARVVLSAKPTEVAECDALVVPGVGAYAACMAALCAIDGDKLIQDWTAAARPMVGICVGHQVLFAGGVEHGSFCEGVGVLPGVVEQIATSRLPHMGWNTVSPPEGTRMFQGLTTQRFYFVHSYAVHHLDGEGVTWTKHGGERFVAAIERGPLWGTQFHPEKSGAAGAALLRNWLRLVEQTALQSKNSNRPTDPQDEAC